MAPDQESKELVDAIIKFTARHGLDGVITVLEETLIRLKAARGLSVIAKGFLTMMKGK